MAKPDREIDKKHGFQALAGPETVERMREDIAHFREGRDAAISERDELRRQLKVAECKLRDIREECAWVAEHFKIGIISREDLPKYIAGHIRGSRDSCVRCGHPKPCPDHFKGM